MYQEINFRIFCGEILVTYHKDFLGNESLEVHRVVWKYRL